MKKSGIRTVAKYGGKTIIVGAAVMMVLDGQDTYASEGAEGLIVSYTPVIGSIKDSIYIVGPPLVDTVENWGANTGFGLQNRTYRTILEATQ